MVFPTECKHTLLANTDGQAIFEIDQTGNKMGVRDETENEYKFIDAGMDLKQWGGSNTEPKWCQIACVVSSERVERVSNCDEADDSCEYVDDWYGAEEE